MLVNRIARPHGFLPLTVPSSRRYKSPSFVQQVIQVKLQTTHHGPPPLGQIVETILYTSDVDKLAAWYRDVMGLTPFFSAPAGVGFQLPGDTLLLLFDRTKVTEDRASERGVIPKHGSPTGLGQHIAFGCGPAATTQEADAAIDAWEQHFKDKGVKIVGTMRWERGGRSVYVHDAEGHVIEVMTRGVWPVY
ncbi:hypothetical protein ACCO45_000428 [Purpureocillium lilacinum]|uniref:Uncharacterized protein n=1 Tax=Purpureocillium lilacinum TaxID=33203 RepID=A0ACC4E464_PURLI